MQFIGKLYEAKTVAEVKQVAARELAAVQGDPIQTANWTRAIKQRLLDVKKMEANSNQNSKEATKVTGVNLGGDKTHNVNKTFYNILKHLNDKVFLLSDANFKAIIEFPNRIKVIYIAISAFILIGLFPPWQFTVDKDSVNGINGTFSFERPQQGVHSHKPAGYALIFSPPINPDNSAGNGVQLDFGRLLIEYSILAGFSSLIVIFHFKKSKNLAVPCI